MELSDGAIVAGRYRLDRLIGEGGMGSVWAATHLITRRGVALKFLRGSVQARPDARRRLLREARAAAAVEHPNVVEILDVLELPDETPVIVMDLLTGETLRDRLTREGQLSLADTAGVLLPVVSAVGASHVRGIVHRDLKPENILLARVNGTVVVKVLDFGVAKLFAGEGVVPSGSILTQAGAAVGTPCYMAPEQATSEQDLDHRVDIWTLGVILYECLSGARPIEGDSVGQVVMRLMSEGITPIERLVLELPDEVARLVGRMLSRERHLRPQTLHDVHEVLSGYTSAATPSFAAPGSDAASFDTALLATESPEVASYTSSGRGGQRVWLLGAAVVAVALAAAVARTWSSEPTPLAGASAAPVPAGSAVPALSSTAPVARVAASSAAPALPSASAAPDPARPRLRSNTRVASPLPLPSAAPLPPPQPSAEFQGGLAENPPF